MRPSTVARIALVILALGFLAIPVIAFASIHMLSGFLISMGMAAVMAVIIIKLLDASFGDYDR